MDKTLDLDELELVVRQWAKHMDGRAFVINCDHLLTLIAAARPAVVSDEVALAVFYEFNRQFRGMNHVEAMRAALALLPGGVPDGYVLVPREPTEAMVNAVWHHWLHGMGHSQECMRDALRAMLSASPKGSPRSLPSWTAQEPPSPTPCDLEWQDISTAPRDRPAVYYWPAQWPHRREYVSVGIYPHHGQFAPPTHWMPRPDTHNRPDADTTEKGKA